MYLHFVLVCLSPLWVVVMMMINRKSHLFLEQISLNGVYVLNSGNKGNNNSSLSFYDFETKKVEADIFKKVNGRGLGDTANDILVYGSKAYIAVTNSNTIEVTDLQGKSLNKLFPMAIRYSRVSFLVIMEKCMYHCMVVM